MKNKKANKRRRPVYRRNSETYYKIYPDATFIAVTNETLFGIASITKGRIVEEDNMNVCLKKEFLAHYRSARKSIKL